MNSCPHDQVEPVGIAPDHGGRVHELADCPSCGVRLHRVSPLHDWSLTDDLPARLLDH
jgi:hypothetical protein